MEKPSSLVLATVNMPLAIVSILVGVFHIIYILISRSLICFSEDPEPVVDREAIVNEVWHSRKLANGTGSTN